MLTHLYANWANLLFQTIYGDGDNDRIDVGASIAFRDTVSGGAGTDLIRSDSNDVLDGCEGVWPLWNG